MSVWRQRRSGAQQRPPGWQQGSEPQGAPASTLPYSERGPRSTVLSGCVAAVELVALALIFSFLGLHGGLFAVPAFVPLLLWMFGCVVSGHTLRPAALARLRGGARVAAAAFVLVVFLLLWSSWSGAALAAWHGHHGGFTLGGYGGAGSYSGAVNGVPSLNGFPTGGSGGISLPSLPDPFPRFPYGSVIAASPVLLGLLWLVLIALGMVAMPGRRRVHTLPHHDFDTTLVPPDARAPEEREAP